MHGEIKLTLNSENYRNEKYMTQIARMKGKNENCMNENNIK